MLPSFKINCQVPKIGRMLKCSKPEPQVQLMLTQSLNNLGQHCEKLAQRPTAFLPRHSANLVGRVIPKSKLPHSHVCTDEFTQTGATYYITIFRFPEGSCSSPQRKEVARVHSRGKLLDSTEGGNCSNLQRRKQMESTKEETAQVL